MGGLISALIQNRELTGPPILRRRGNTLCVCDGVLDAGSCHLESQDWMSVGVRNDSGSLEGSLGFDLMG